MRNLCQTVIKGQRVLSAGKRRTLAQRGKVSNFYQTLTEKRVNVCQA